MSLARVPSQQLSVVGEKKNFSGLNYRQKNKFFAIVKQLISIKYDLLLLLSLITNELSVDAI